MRKIHAFSIHPKIPERLSGLQELAFNLRWSWDSQALAVFQRLDADMFERCGHNPVLLLRRISREKLDEVAENTAFLSVMDEAVEDLHRYLETPGWYQQSFPDSGNVRIAYFCMEYGLTACLPIYSGGLGVLAGDHLKAASDLNVPLVAVGLLYQKGYFVQTLDQEGWQQESYRMLDPGALPIRPITMGAPGSPEAGSPLRIHIEIHGRRVWAQPWLAQVGRIPLYLLNTAVPENDAQARLLTSELYGGGAEERLAQELLLGIGGMRVLTALGIKPQMVHMNEGHTVFAGLERIRQLMQDNGLSFYEARQTAGAGSLFTTHTPVPAGFDLFPRPLIESDLGAYVREMGMEVGDLMRMGKTNDEDPDVFNVAVLALRESPRRNAVSRLHRRVTAEMMQPGWPEFPKNEVPIESVTNGVHTMSWLASEMATLYDTYLGSEWREDSSLSAAWEGVDRIPDLELWRIHSALRERLIAYAREQSRLHAREKWGAGGWHASAVLRPDALTIGFARRFATYKRATLILSDLDRLKRILLDEKRPVQMIMAGKAHPRDGAGKEFIREILEVVRREGLTSRVVFVEDYDISKAALLVQGVDVWLNTPRRPFEACGTSGMKVVPNGGLNLSILDGWWAESYRPGVGWAIGDGQEYLNHEYQDHMDADHLYGLLENEIVPLFFDRDADEVPIGWTKMMKESIQVLTPALSGVRMVKEYAERFYVPGAAHHERLAADDFSKARELTAWKARLRSAWSQVGVSWVVEK
jgi:starch phosphorylase